MSSKIGDGFSEKAMSPNFGDAFFQQRFYVSIFRDVFFGKALCPRILVIDSRDGATLLSKVLALTN